MNWTESTPINPTNLNDLEGRIATADANVTAGKAAVAAAITAMGQTATGSETYAQLAGHIADISDDATAVDAEVLATKTFYRAGAKGTGSMPDRGSVGTQNLTTEGQEYTIAAGYHNGLGKVKAVITNLIASVLKHGAVVGGITGNYDTEASVPITAATVLIGKKGRVNGATITGTMPDRAGDTAALAQTRSGTTVKLRASEGFRDGTNDYVTHTDANDTAENIRATKTIRGLTGTFTADADAISSDIVLGKTAYVNGIKLTGNHSPIKSIQTGISYTPYGSYDNEAAIISAVDVNKSIVLCYKYGASVDRLNMTTAFGYLASSTSLHTYTMGAYSGTLEVYWQVIEFNGIKSLNRGEVSTSGFTSGTPYYKDITIPAVNLSKTMIFMQCFTTASDTEDEASYNTSFGAYMLNSTTLRITKNSSADRITAYYYVVEFD